MHVAAVQRKPPLPKEGLGGMGGGEGGGGGNQDMHLYVLC